MSSKFSTTKIKRLKIQEYLTENHVNIPLVKDESGVEKVNLMELTRCRLDEIEKLHQSMKESRHAGAKRVFQTLPKHLRRRAASHQPNRVPRRHRTKSSIEHEKMRSSDEKPKKMRFGNRKRNKKSLMDQRLHTNIDGHKSAWLETHYWYAKRFHMDDIWGYRLPMSNNGKVYRTVIKRALDGRGLMYDLSYEIILQLTAPKEKLKDFLLKLDSTSIMKEDDHYQRGVLICRDSNSSIIGPVSFTWFLFGIASKLLLFVHPSISEAIEAKISSMLATDFVGIDWMKLNRHFNRFEFTGKDILKVFGQVLRPHGVNGEAFNNLVMGLRKERYLLPDDFVMTFQVEDPRLSFPHKRELEEKRIKIKDLIFKSENLFASLENLIEKPKRVTDKCINNRRHEARRNLQLGPLIFDENRDSLLHIFILKKNPLVPILDQGTYELWIPQRFGVDFWRSFIYSNNVFPLSIMDRFHLFEVFNQAAVSTIKHDKIYGFPLFYPEAKVAFQSIFLKSLEEFKERERRRPSDKKFLAQPSGKELLSSLETLVEKSFMPDSFSSRVSRVTFLGRGKGNPYSLIYATKPNLEVGEVRALLELFKSSAPLPWNTKQWGYSLCDEINIVGFLINPKIASQSSTCKSSRRLNKSSGFNLLLGKSSSLASIFEGSCIANSSLLNIAKLVQSPTNNASNGFDTGAYQVEIEKMQFIRAKLIELMRNGESLVWIRPLNTPWLYYPASMKSESMWME